MTETCISSLFFVSCFKYVEKCMSCLFCLKDCFEIKEYTKYQKALLMVYMYAIRIIILSG